MKRDTDTATRMRIRYEGTVQGVGFRYTVLHLAKAYPITGFVRNEMDGTVLLVAEGDQNDLSAFHREISTSRLERYIHRALISWEEGTGEYNTFDVNYQAGRSFW